MGGPSDEGRKRLLLKEALNARALYVMRSKSVNHEFWQDNPTS